MGSLAFCVGVVMGKGGLWRICTRQCCVMKAVIGIKMPPKVVLLGIKKNIVFCMGMIKSLLFMFLFLGGQRVKPL